MDNCGRISEGKESGGKGRRRRKRRQRRRERQKRRTRRRTKGVAGLDSARDPAITQADDIGGRHITRPNIK